MDEHEQAAFRVRALVSPVSIGGAEDLPIFATGEKGIIRIRRPSGGVSRVILWSDESSPIEKIEANSRMGGTIVLPRGCVVRGVVVGDDAKPVRGVAASAVFPLGTSSRGIRRRTASTEDGRFDVGGLPCGVSILTLTKTGLAPLRRKLTISEGTLDLGRVILRPSMSVRLLILDAKSGRPISGARVALAGEPAVATSGRDGTALLDGIGRNENADVEASAAGYLPATAHLQNGLKQPAVIRMTAGATIVARVVGRNDQRPEGPGTLFIDLAGTKKIEHFGADGIVRIGGLSPGKLNIDVRVPGFASRKLPQRELVTGESVDFGTVALPAGYAISGTVVDAMTSAPLQAHVRVPRPNPSGALLSVVMKDWIEAATDDAGQFQLTGLAAGDYRLLVESPGFAPALTERVTVGADQKDTDVGVVRLSAGRRLVIACRPARRCGSKAELLLGDPNDDWAT
ncbi:MAG TPA: carboxypeptidase-like regulatory domain-containing protein, partial [Vicinamibacterales bacterium]|nr:carboxypeptidase-like regulatory domain-containing protein [Vicinamibacterales bacterium]